MDIPPNLKDTVIIAGIGENVHGFFQYLESIGTWGIVVTGFWKTFYRKNNSFF